MSRLPSVFLCGIVVVWAVLIPSIPLPAAPPAGSIYREFARHNGGNHDWRVTDDQAIVKFAQAAEFLPNSKVTFEIDDLKDAVRAEAILDRWGGHRGTINKRIRFNSKAWLPVAELTHIPLGLRSEHLMYQDNPVVDVPLSHLVEGLNLLEADCDEAGGFGWGQWGLYSMILRVYYDPVTKGQELSIAGEITSPGKDQQITDQPTIELTATSASGVARIDVVASYSGYDENGDGEYDGWHESFFQPLRGAANHIRDHAGTLWKQPYRITWDTHWVPDQLPNGIALIARVQDSRGYWRVTEPIRGLTLVRSDVSVQQYNAEGMTEDFGVRAGQTKRCSFTIPDDVDLKQVSEAALHLRTWHGWDGHHHPLKFNDHAMRIEGKNHFYDYDLLPIPVETLRSGRNELTFSSDTEHHQLEVLWPGPSLVVRFATQRH